MNILNNRAAAILKYAAAAIAVLNLVLLFGGETYPPQLFGRASEPEETESSAPVETPEGFAFETEALTYSGGDLDLLEGVSFRGLTAEELRRNVFARVSAGDAIDRKVITYTVNTDEGQVSGTRELILSQYTGPVLHLPDTLPTVPLSDPEGIIGELRSKGLIRCDDGFGEDISAALTCTVTLDPTNARHAVYRFTLTNMFNDTAYVTADGTLAPDIPYIELTTDTVNLTVGDDFGDPYSYVARAVDTDGSSIGSRVRCYGSVDNRTEGTYALTYTASNAAGAAAHTVTLTVRVTAS